MKIEIKVPAMGESITEATVATILKATGTTVAADEEIIELETDKVNQVLFAPQKGVITISVSTGDIVKIGQVIGFVESDGVSKVEETPQTLKEKIPQPNIKQEPVLAKESVKKEPEVKPENSKAPLKVEAPSARTSIKDAVSDLMPDDKQTLKEMPKVLIKPHEKDNKAIRKESRRKMSKIRQVIAARLVQAQHQAAMLTTFNEVDMSEIMSLRERYKDTFTKEHGVKLGFMSFFIKAAVAALEAFPDVNSYIEGDEIVSRHYYDIGIAVGTDRGLVVPVIRNCDILSFSGIELTIEEYAKKARSGGLTIDDLTGGGFTITNGGVYGSLLSTPILNLPQSAILGMHKIMKRAVVVDDQIVIRPMMYLALSYDHRIIDGKEAVSFLVTIKNMLEDPTRLLLEV
jgi:2-oxoglutarate dehydrogenase E2 component (dihydrolipoamide succinyltransferase)